VRVAIEEARAALDTDDNQLATSLDSLIKAARRLTKALEQRSPS
jgi:hypothetical protein